MMITISLDGKKNIFIFFIFTCKFLVHSVLYKLVHLVTFYLCISVTLCVHFMKTCCFIKLTKNDDDDDDNKDEDRIKSGICFISHHHSYLDHTILFILIVKSWNSTVFFSLIEQKKKFIIIIRQRK